MTHTELQDALRGRNATDKQIEDLIRLINERVASTREPISTLRDKIAEKLNSGVSIVSITSFVERF